MHELSVTEGLLKICLDEGEKHKIKKVTKVKVKVGELSDLIPSCISYYFNIVAKGTIAENAEILVEKIPVSINCKECGYNGVLPRKTYTCPKCNGNKYEITKGREFYLDTMEVE